MHKKIYIKKCMGISSGCNCSDKYSLVSRKVKTIWSPEMLWTVFLASKSSKFENWPGFFVGLSTESFNLLNITISKQEKAVYSNKGKETFFSLIESKLCVDHHILATKIPIHTYLHTLLLNFRTLWVGTLWCQARMTKLTKGLSISNQTMYHLITNPTPTPLKRQNNEKSSHRVCIHSIRLKLILSLK